MKEDQFKGTPAPDRLLAAIVDSSEDAIISKNLDGIITSWNKAAERIFGHTAAEAVGKPGAILFPADRMDEEPRILERIRRGERIEHFQTVRLRKDGTPIQVSLTLSPIKDEHGIVIGASKIARDVTADKSRERAGLLLAAIVDSSDDAIASKTLEGIVTSWNKAAERIFGYTGAEIIGKSITLLFPEDRLHEEAMFLQRIRRGERVEHFETIRKTKDGRMLDVSVTLSPIMDASGTIVGVSKIARDITDQKRAQRELERMNERLKEVDRLKSEFLATMSHELRTPLNSIIGFTGIVMQGLAGPLNDEQKKQLGMAYNSARHLLSLISDLLDLSRIESGRMEIYPEDFDPRTVVEDVVKTLSPAVAQKQIQLTSDLQLPAQMHTDRKMFYQVLLNLANNAVKFTPKGEVKIVGRTSNGSITVAVEDTGIGIKPEQMALLFQAFRQAEGSAARKYEGTGLGLYLSRQLVKLLGGEIRAESEYGKGSRFSFTVPTHGPPAPSAK